MPSRAAARWRGATAIMSTIVVQLGLAMIPLCLKASSLLTSATTSGTSGSIRKADELSTTMAPASANAGAYWRLRSPPAEKRAMSMPAGSAVARSSTSMPPKPVERTVPAERSDAMSRNRPTGKDRSARMSRMTRPTAPVAPTTATVRSLILRFLLGGSSGGELARPRCSGRRR